MVREWWAGALGASLRRIAQRVWPAFAPWVWLGFCANGSQREDTASTGNAFHEIGWFGTEAGLAGGPAPNPDPAAQWNTWGRVHAAPAVVAALGRPATMVPDAWKDAVDDQVAVGVQGVRDHYAEAVGAIGAALRPTEGTPWSAAVAFASWSAGAGQLAAHLHPIASQLATVPEVSRVDAWARATITHPRPGHKHANPAWTVLRTLQKLAAAELANPHTQERSGGRAGPWFSSTLTAAEVDRLLEQAELCT